MEALEEKERRRLLFMKTVYNKTQGDRFTFTDLVRLLPQSASTQMRPGGLVNT